MVVVLLPSLLSMPAACLSPFVKRRRTWVATQGVQAFTTKATMGGSSGGGEPAAGRKVPTTSAAGLAALDIPAQAAAPGQRTGLPPQPLQPAAKAVRGTPCCSIPLTSRRHRTNCFTEWFWEVN